MKILFIGNIFEQSGWSTQQVNHVLALDRAGITVIPCNINVLNNRNPDLPPRILELAQQDDPNPDIIIQNVLPSMLEYTGRAKCVAYFVCETSNFKNTNWARRLNLQDAVLCPCWHNKQAAIESGVDPKKIHIMPEAINVEMFNRQYEQHQIRKNFPNDFIFYTVSEFTVRKNVEAIVRAFHLEFSPVEPVQLVIKTTPVGMNNPSQELNQRLEVIKKGLKLYNSIDRYKRENIICGFAAQTEIYELHNSCDAYVCASRGEAFNIPLVEAMGFGKTIVSVNHSGMDFVNDKNAFVVNSYRQPCFNANDTLSDLYTSNEDWFEMDINSLRENMRSAFEKRSLAIKKQQQAKRDIQAFSHEVVGQTYRKLLEKLL